MPVSQCKCPLCKTEAHGSDIDFGNRARVYCPACSTYDITKSAFEELVVAAPDHRQAIAQRAKAAPAGKLLAITRDGSAYEDKEPKTDRAAPSWLTQ